MSKKTKSILIFLFGLLISLFLGYSVWESGYLQTADNKASQEQQVASDTSEQDKAAADQAAADKAAADKAAADQAAADKAAADQAAADQAAADKAAADQAAADKAAADQAAVDKAAADKAAADKAAADKAAADQAAADKAAADKAAADKAAADQAAADKAAAENAQKSAEIQKAMGFDILRIEPTGDTVIAGLAPAAAKVAIVDALDGNKAIAQAVGGVSGEFAIVLDTPLGEGKHELSIQATDKEGKTYISDEVALVEVFAATMNKTPVVILSKSGVATRMLQGEEIQTAEENATEEATTTEETTTEEAPEEVEAKPEPVNAVYIKAADVEGDRLIIAGTGPVDGTLNMYLNDLLLGQAKISENNTFIYEKKHSLEAGRHSIRADRVDPVTNKVLGRAEVSLLHEPEVAGVEETATTQASTEETASEESTTTEEAASQDAASDENSTQEATQEQASAEGEDTEEAKDEIRTGTTVIIRRGDSLWRVSHKNYGEGMKFTTIFEANKDQIKDPNLIYPGQVFNIPEAQ